MKYNHNKKQKHKKLEQAATKLIKRADLGDKLKKFGNKNKIKLGLD